MRAILIAAALTVVAIGAPLTAEALAKHYNLNIPRQPLDSALKDFAQQTGLQIARLVGTEATDIAAGPVSGELSAEDALEALLAPGGLTYQVVNERTIAVVDVSRRLENAAPVDSGAQRPAAAPSGQDVKGDQKKSFWDRLRVAQVDQGASVGAAPAAETPAGDQAVRLEEIVVTAQKREERLQDIPMSISVISGQDIDRRGLIGMEDYLRSVPGANQIDRGAADNAIVIRGITTSPQSENTSSGPTVATYFGETPITGAGGRGAGGIDLRPVDLERIEMLRGPQGTAYGSSSLGGALRLIPAQPKLDAFGAKVVGSFSNTSGEGDDNSMMQGVVNIPLVADKLAVRAVGYRYDESGYYRNIAGLDPATIAAATARGIGSFVQGFVQDNRGEMRTTGGRFAALWKLTDRFDVSASYLQQKIEQDGDPVANRSAYDQAKTPIALQGRVRGEADAVNDNEIDLANLVLNYDLGWGTLTSASSWIEGSAIIAQPSTALPLASTTVPGYFRSFTEEARFASSFEGRFQVLGGIYYERIKDGSEQRIDWPGPVGTIPLGTNPLLADIDVDRKLDQRAVFGEVSYRLTDQLTATAGGRYFKYDREENRLSEGAAVRVPIGTGVRVNTQSDEAGTSFKAALSYQATQNALLYASWAEGFRLGYPQAGVAPGVCDINPADGLIDGTNVSVASTRMVTSDFLDNYEIGGKLAFFDRRMTLDASAYHIRWDGLPIRTVPPCNSVYTANVGQATSNGVELQASLAVLRGLRLDFGGSYNDAELSRDAPGLIPPAFKGDRLPGSPKVNANLAAQYDFDAFGHAAFVRADSFYTGRFYGDLRQTPGLAAGDYIKVDARIGVAIRSLSVELYARNLTNEDAYTWRGMSTTIVSDFRLRPRTFGVQLGYSFE